MKRILLSSVWLLWLAPLMAGAQEAESEHRHHEPVQEATKPEAETPPAQDHAQHRQAATEPTSPLTPIPAITEADRRAAKPPAAHAMHGDGVHSYVLFDRLEWSDSEGGAFAWEAEAWIGTDTDRLWLRSEGEAVRDGSDHAELELLYSHSVSPWWDVLVGLRYENESGENRESLAFGIRGLAPQKIELAATVYVGTSGRTDLRLKLGYDAWLSERWILHPELEFNAHGRSDPDRGIGAGLGTMQAGLRLRYEITRQFAPYVGLEYQQAFGGTADFRRREGESVRDARLVLGLRVWF